MVFRDFKSYRSDFESYDRMCTAKECPQKRVKKVFRKVVNGTILLKSKIKGENMSCPTYVLKPRDIARTR